MRRDHAFRERCLTLVGVVFFALVGLPGLARADEPMLAIRLAGGESAIYAVSEIDQMRFDGDTLVVLSAGGADGYAAETIRRIECLWDFSGLEDPEEAAAMLKAVHLFQNQPNPSSAETRIEFELPQSGRVELGIYSVQGRLIRTLVDEELATGPHKVMWDGRDRAGQEVPGGVYFYNLTAPGIKESRQMILLP